MPKSPRTAAPADVAEKAHEVARKIGLQRPFKRDPDDPADNTSGGFNQKSGQPEEAKVTATSHDQIRDRAYALWEEAGRPDGRDKEFWEAAERQLSERSDLDLSQERDEVQRPPVQAGLPIH